MEILYKYVSAERALLCLPEIGDGPLRATQPAAFNDPMECAVVAGSRRGDQEGREGELAETLTRINDATPVSETEVAQARHTYGSLFLKELLAQQLSQRFGIVSFASDPRHPLMWAHYTVDGSGFAIGYDSKQIRALTARADSLLRVTYQRGPFPLVVNASQVFTEETANALLSFKSAHWIYEDEWRLIAELSETIGTGYSDRHGYSINLLRVPNPAVVSVYYTERTPVEYVAAIEGRLSDKNNRYGALRPTKLVLARDVYGYEDAEAAMPRNDS